MAETPDEIYDKVLAEEQAKGSSPAVAEARAKAARHRARKGLPTDPKAAAAASSGAAPASDPTTVETAAPQETPVAAAVGAAPAGRAGRAASAGPDVAPERIQRLLAVVRPEAIQRVEREPIDRVNVWPHLLAIEMVALLAMTAFLVIYSTFINAPFRELANINVTPNPSKAPWYFLGLQELLRYFHPQVAGVTIPQWIILGLMAAPYIDRNPSVKPKDRKLAIALFTIFMLMNAMLVILGSIFRGPGFNFVYPWSCGEGAKNCIFFEL